MKLNAKHWAWLAALAFVLLRLPSMNLPLDRDEGEAATLAWTWGQGLGVPYKDYFELKPPGPIGVHAVAQGLFNDGVRGLRWLSLAYGLATVLGLMALVLGLGRRGKLGAALQQQASRRWQAAAWTGFCAAILLNSSRTQALAAQPEAWQNLPLLMAVACLALPQELGWRQLLAAGLSLGLASFHKQTALAGIVLLPLGLAQGRWRAALGLAAGALLAWAGLALLFSSQGAARQLWDCVWAYGFTYAAPADGAAWRRGLGLALRLAPSLGFFVALGAWGLRCLRVQGGRWGFLAAWLLLSLACLAASGRYYPHYIIPLLLPLSMAAGLGLAHLGGPKAWLRRGMLTLAVFAYLQAEGALWTSADPADRGAHLYGLNSVGAAPAVGRRLQELCPEGQRLFLWGNDSQVYYLARRAPASRYLYVYMFNGEAPEIPGGKEALLQALRDPGTGAVAVSSSLDLQDPFQRSLYDALQQGYAPEPAAAPFVLGARKP